MSDGNLDQNWFSLVLPVTQYGVFETVQSGDVGGYRIISRSISALTCYVTLYKERGGK